MPDHLHAIVAFARESSMSATVKAWKSYLTRAASVVWQDGYFDHRLRNREEAASCWQYLRQNPVRAGLVADMNEWPWVWWPGDPAAPE